MALSHGHQRFLRFIAAGVANTLFGFAVYSAAVLGGVPVWGALVAGNVAGIGFNFLTTGGYVFRDLALTRLPRFIAAYLLLYGLNLLAINGLAHWVSGPIFAQAILTPPMSVLSYFFMARFVFLPVKSSIP
jgi:putative flippase GtrA